MDYYPKIKLITTPIYKEYEETRESWSLFTGTRTIKTGNILKDHVYTDYKVITNVRYKNNNIWYIIAVSDSIRICVETTGFNVDRLINKVLSEALNVKKYFIFPKTLTVPYKEYIKIDSNQKEILSDKMP